MLVASASAARTAFKIGKIRGAATRYLLYEKSPDKSSTRILTFYRAALPSPGDVSFRQFSKLIAMSSPSNPSSDTGLASNIGAGICAVFPLIGGIIFYFIEKKDQLVRHWAVQGIFFGGTAFVVSIVISIITIVLAVAHVGFLGSLISLAWNLCCLVLWVLGLINAFQGKRWEYPIISEQCKKLFPKLVP